MATVGTMNATLTNLLGETLKAILPAALEPGPVTFKAADERGVRVVREACRQHAPSVTPLRRVLERNPFLCGCLDLTEHDDHEHLIVGLGHKHGPNRTRIQAIAHVIGDRGSVSIPEIIHHAVQRHFLEAKSAEVIWFHNHPINPWNRLFDNTPLASVTDRRTATSTILQPLSLLKTLLGGGSHRFFLGENGFVREFVLPPLS